MQGSVANFINGYKEKRLSLIRQPFYFMDKTNYCEYFMKRSHG